MRLIPDTLKAARLTYAMFAEHHLTIGTMDRTGHGKYFAKLGDVVRKFYDVPEDAVIESCFDQPWTREVIVVISHPSFDVVHEANTLLLMPQRDEPRAEAPPPPKDDGGYWRPE